MHKYLKNAIAFIKRNKFNTKLMRHFDWFLFLIVLVISAFGIVSIFAATSTSVTTTPTSVMEMIRTQPTHYATLQLAWVGAGLIVMTAMLYFHYELFGKYSDAIYWLNIFVLLAVLTVEAGRGGMSAFFTWGSSNSSLGTRGFQPSEFGKIAMIIALAKVFSRRTEPIRKVRDLLAVSVYVAIPTVLVLMQPDMGTALVYVVIFATLLYVSGTSYRLIVGVLCVLAIILVPLWFYLNTASNSFRLTRILMWLDPASYPDEARQVINGQIAVGSGGLWGKGIVSTGSFASLGYISDDHTDFCFSIVCEAFGFVGACILVALFALMMARLVYLAIRTEDLFGTYLIVGVTAMFAFHIFENICMIIGLMPVTGIPLPFVSYGGSNLLTNMMGIGLVINVHMRARYRTRSRNRLTSVRI